MVALLMVMAGFLLAAFASVMEAEGVRWGVYVIGAVVMSVGIYWRAMKQRSEVRSSTKVTADLAAIGRSLATLKEKARGMSDERDTLTLEAIQARLEAHFPEALETFVEARKTMIHAYSLETYAEVMTDFAAGERYLNRVWSASVDGYLEEARTYIAKFADQFALAQKRFLAASLPASVNVGVENLSGAPVV